MISPTRPRRALPVLTALAGLVLPVAVGLTSGASASAHAATARQEPAQRYITALVSKKEVKKGAKVTISGAVEAPVEAPACAAGVVLTVERSTKGATYNVVGTVTTSTAGAYSTKVKVTKKSRFRITAPATDACSALQSPPRTVKIK